MENTPAGVDAESRRFLVRKLPYRLQRCRQAVRHKGLRGDAAASDEPQRLKCTNPPGPQGQALRGQSKQAAIAG